MKKQQTNGALPCLPFLGAERRWLLLFALIMATMMAASSAAQEPSQQDPAYPGQLYPDQSISGNQNLQDTSPYSPNGQPQTGNPDRSARQGYDLNNDLDPQGTASTQSRDGYRNQISDLYRLDQSAPEPPTEFQMLVANSTGVKLPIFGSWLFQRTPSTFAPLDKVPVTLDYVIGPGDELLIQAWGQISLNSRFTVDRSGDIFIPKVGSVHVAGETFGSIRDSLRTQMGRVFRNFDLNVNLGQLRSIQIFVVGNARRPGSYTISSLSTLVDALFVTGGPNSTGSLRHIQLKRAGKVISDLDLYDLLIHGDKSGDVALLPKDVIYIPPVGAQVAVAGSVHTPAIYELKSGTSLSVAEVMELASGPTNTAGKDTVRLERIAGNSERTVLDLKLDTEGLRTQVRDGDILELGSIIDRFKNGVTLRGNVANPGHYLWHANMHVSELIPNKDALITRDYWIRQGKLGKPSLTYLMPCRERPRGAEQGSAVDATAQANRDRIAAGLSPQENDKEGIDCLPEPQGNGFDRSTSTSTQPNDANAYRTAQGLQATNGLDPQFANQLNGQLNGQLNNQRQNAMAASASSTANALVASGQGQFQPRNDVQLTEPDIDWSYAVVERQDKQTLTTSLLPFNLGQLVLNGNTSQDIELQPGDVVTIFSKADIRVPQTEQTRFVRLEGEFRSAGVYSVRPGETLQSLVQRAGGFTQDAYLYGSEFTRESTRRLQQQRLNEYINQIALDESAESVSSAGRSLSAIYTAATSAQAEQSQALINSLRQLRASGRIVLQMSPNSSGIAQLPQMPLEDGDRFVVPHVPVTVAVAGAVYNPNSFLFDPRRRLGDYLKLAGGPNKNADRKSAYVIRADGSVVSKRAMSSWRSDQFESLRIFPGDDIVVPLNLSKGATLRSIVDIAQIAGQFGLAAAASATVF